jgi:Ca2+-binding RTX toxin-like protein
VVFGKSSGFITADLDLTLSIDGIKFVNFNPNNPGVPDPNAHTGTSVASVGDFHFGFPTAGDFNNDGYSDIIIGVPGSTLGAGFAAVLFGGRIDQSPFDIGTLFVDGNTSGFIIAGDAGAQAGYSVASAGDVNNDGFGDIIVGAPGWDGGPPPAGVDWGAAYVIYGTDSLSGVIDPNNLNGSNGFRILNEIDQGLFDSRDLDSVGFSVASAGDRNGDGFDDLIVGSPFYTDIQFIVPLPIPTVSEIHGAVQVVYGFPVSPIFHPSIFDFEPTLPLADFAPRGFGASVASGDFNGDGISDVFVGSPFAGTDPEKTGKVNIFLAASGDEIALLGYSIFNSSNSQPLTGTSVASAGDINDDGVEDIIIGAPGADDPDVFTAEPGLLNDAGASYVVFGLLPQSAVIRVGTDASEKVIGGNFDDSLSGLGGNDRLYGNGGVDTLRGGPGRDLLKGGDGDDFLTGGPGEDILMGGAGLDTADFSDRAGVVADLFLGGATSLSEVDLLDGIENLIGSPLDDTLKGDGNANALIGGDGEDVLYGRGGHDTLIGGPGISDTARYDGNRADYFISQDGDGRPFTVIDDRQNSPDGIDNVSGVEFLQFADQIGTVVSGGPGDDTLFGIQSADVLLGNGGNDILVGGRGNDYYDGGTGTDTASFLTESGPVIADLPNFGALSGGFIDYLIRIENVIGSPLNDTLIGDANANLLDGADGNDDLTGGGGNDRLIGSVGTDIAHYSGNLAAYSVTLNANGTWAVADNRAGSPDGTDTLGSVEIFRFANGDMNIGSEANDHFPATGAPEVFIGGAGQDTVSYGDAPIVISPFAANLVSTQSVTSGTGLVASLADPSTNTGWAAGDTYVSIENLIGSAFDDKLSGDNNDNVLEGGPGRDKLLGGNGIDTASYEHAAGAVTASLSWTIINTGAAAGDSYSSIENLIGSAFNDQLIGNHQSNVLEGGPGADRLFGGGGPDTASYAHATSGVIADLWKPAQNTGDAAGDRYISIQNLIGSAFADKLTGDADANVLEGGLGADQLNGSKGSDTASYEHATSGVTADLSNASNNTGEAAGDTYTSIENLLGSDFDDRLVGDALDNVLTGRGGKNVLIGNGGKDTLIGGLVADILYGGVGNDTLTGGLGADLFSWGGEALSRKVHPRRQDRSAKLGARHQRRNPYQLCTRGGQWQRSAGES